MSSIKGNFRAAEFESLEKDTKYYKFDRTLVEMRQIFWVPVSGNGLRIPYCLFEVPANITSETNELLLKQLLSRLAGPPSIEVVFELAPE